MKKQKRYLVGDVLNILGISRNTLYLWELKGKIKIKRDPMNGYRYWTEKGLKDLRKITQR